MEFYDADIQDYPRIPCYLIFDEEGRKLGPIGIPIVNDERYDASWSEDNLRRRSNKGWIKKGNSLEDIAAQIDVNPKVLRPLSIAGMNSARKGKTKTTNARRKP